MAWGTRVAPLAVSAVSSLRSLSDSTVDSQPHYLDLEIALLIFNKWVPIVYVTFGVFGNMTSLLITTKKENRNVSTCVYMSALAVMDTVVLLSRLIYGLLFGHGLGEAIHADSRFFTLIFIWYTTNTWAMASGLCLAMMSLDRACVVLFPFKARAHCTASRAKKAVTATFLIPAILNINMFFTYSVIVDGTTGTESASLDFPEPAWVEIAVGAYMLALGTILPFVVIITCNILIINSVRRAIKGRSRMAVSKEDPTAKSSEERHLTRMLILVSVAYVVLSVPFRIFDLILTIPEVVAKYIMSDPYWQLRLGVEIWSIGELWNMNYAVNFYLYILGGGKKFRKDAREVYTSCCIKGSK